MPDIGTLVCIGLAIFAVLTFVFFQFFTVRKINPQEEVDKNAALILEAVLMYGKQLLSNEEYARYKSYIESQVIDGEGGKRLSDVVEEAIDYARKEEGVEELEADNGPAEER